MNIKKLERIRQGNNPLIRITYEKYNLFGKIREIVRDVVTDAVLSAAYRYIYCDDGSMVHNHKDVILRFQQSEELEYIVNGKP